MYKYINFAVNGNVRGQARPRFTGKRRKGKKQAYEKPEDTAYKKSIAKAYREAANGVFFTGEVTLTIHVYRKMPKSKKGDNEPDIYKPDVDNIAKAVMDALNGVAYEDDKQVFCLSICKHKRVKSRLNDELIVTVCGEDYDN